MVNKSFSQQFLFSVLICCSSTQIAMEKAKKFDGPTIYKMRERSSIDNVYSKTCIHRTKMCVSMEGHQSLSFTHSHPSLSLTYCVHRLFHYNHCRKYVTFRDTLILACSVSHSLCVEKGLYSQLLVHYFVSLSARLHGHHGDSSTLSRLS